MRHMLFAASLGAALCLGTTRTIAQSVPAPQPVPGRALLDFPLGTLAEVPALATASGGGLSNPGALLAEPTGHVRLAVGQLNAQGTRGATGQFAAINGPLFGATLGIGFARMSVDGLERTGDGGPQVLGDIRYDTYVLSLEGAKRLGGPLRHHLVVGLAGRLRAAHDDTVSASTSALDVGVVADGLLGRRDLRLAAASYLWRPGDERVERPGLRLGADAHVAGPDPLHEARVGVSHDETRGATAETGLFVAGRWTYAEGRLGVARATGYGSAQDRLRVGLAFHAERLTVGVAHEGSAPSFGSLWQFTLSTRLP